MNSFELVARTAVEMAGVWTVTWLVTSIIRSLCNRAGKVPNVLKLCHLLQCTLACMHILDLTMC